MRDMNPSLLPHALLFALLLSFAGAPRAQDPTGLGGLPQGAALPGAGRAEALRARSMSLSMSYAIGAKSVQVPFLASAHDPVFEISRHLEAGRSGPRASCEHSASDLCYDLDDRRIVYRPARQYMPSVKGLVAENISVRRDSIHFRYSFR